MVNEKKDPGGVSILYNKFVCLFFFFTKLCLFWLCMCVCVYIYSLLHYNLQFIYIIKKNMKRRVIVVRNTYKHTDAHTHINFKYNSIEYKMK